TCLRNHNRKCRPKCTNHREYGLLCGKFYHINSYCYWNRKYFPVVQRCCYRGNYCKHSRNLYSYSDYTGQLSVYPVGHSNAESCACSSKCCPEHLFTNKYIHLRPYFCPAGDEYSNRC